MMSNQVTKITENCNYIFRKQKYSNLMRNKSSATYAWMETLVEMVIHTTLKPIKTIGISIQTYIMLETLKISFMAKVYFYPPSLIKSTNQNETPVFQRDWLSLNFFPYKLVFK